MSTYRGNKPGLDLQNKIVILVDDGIATGATAKAALMSIRKRYVPVLYDALRGPDSRVHGRHPEKVILAAPVMPFDRIGQFHGLVDELVVLAAPKRFNAVGQFYSCVRGSGLHEYLPRCLTPRFCQFDQTEDKEVLERLEDANLRFQGELKKGVEQKAGEGRMAGQMATASK